MVTSLVPEAPPFKTLTVTITPRFIQTSGHLHWSARIEIRGRVIGSSCVLSIQEALTDVARKIEDHTKDLGQARLHELLHDGGKTCGA